VRRIEDYGRLGFGVHLRVSSASEVDREVAALVREAYAGTIRGVRKPVARRRHPRVTRLARAT
jgi:hypothetical protein